jgi:hypothetical protein
MHEGQYFLCDYVGEVLCRGILAQDSEKRLMIVIKHNQTTYIRIYKILTIGFDNPRTSRDPEYVPCLFMKFVV